VSCSVGAFQTAGQPHLRSSVRSAWVLIVESYMMGQCSWQLSKKTQVDGSRTRVKTCSVTAAGLPPWPVRSSEIRPGGRRVVSLHLTGRDGPGPDGRRRPEITLRSLSSRRRSPRSIRASNFLTRRQARSVHAGEGAPAARARLPEARATSASTAPAL